MNRWLTLIAALALPLSALAAGASTAEVQVTGAWSRALPPVSANGAAYLTVTNHGAAPDRLVAASSPKAGRAELHAHLMQGGMMQMREIAGGVALGPGETVAFEPGGRHVMLIGLTSPLVAGERFPLTLEFERAGRLEIAVTVRSTGAKAGTGGHGSMTGHGHGAPAMKMNKPGS